MKKEIIFTSVWTVARLVVPICVTVIVLPTNNVVAETYLTVVPTTSHAIPADDKVLISRVVLRIAGLQRADETQRQYEKYFHEICEPKGQCNDTCKKVFDKIERKDSLGLKC